MTKDEVRRKILEVGIVPVVRASSRHQAQMAVEAIWAGGIPIAEITMTVPGAIEVIAQLSRSIGSEVLIGAGTCLDTDTAKACLQAGAQFLVSPGFDCPTVELARQQDTLVMAGALTATEVITAFRSGSDFVKIFPCGNVGGPSYIKALKAALPQIPMVPTGGVNLQNAAEFLLAGASAIGVGGELISRAALEAGDAAAITAMARQYVDALRGVQRGAC
ncbi:MAG TPA: bifunctional 4-hydroxy-2-oxoglutarate aldolase/2-dehydro-3-deoxy-phosphogluconate aldolase [Bryobacteraceae bacterium]|jgi:2-dehydro-3-deoxyphosphogluconate aldolase/(4S)-4-hydroxy-2-oxoglutarate aldolase|nr:bifunctional 4-hydroxy-2-oxoglutarate aldolase/2-dehydro-3-deoxy-phosphogluconate aldolase [Bryobacteraceae bacterium]